MVTNVRVTNVLVTKRWSQTSRSQTSGSQTSWSQTSDNPSTYIKYYRLDVLSNNLFRYLCQFEPSRCKAVRNLMILTEVNILVGKPGPSLTLRMGTRTINEVKIVIRTKITVTQILLFAKQARTYLKHYRISASSWVKIKTR